MEMFEDDVTLVQQQTGHRNVPEDVVVEYGIRMRMAAGSGHTGTMGMFPMIDMLRYLGYVPRTKKSKPQQTTIRWSDVRPGLPVIADSPETGEIKGWFEGDFGHGVLAVRSPFSPNLYEIYAKYVRPATEDDDMGCLNEGVPPAFLATSEDDEELAYDEGPPSRQEPRAAVDLDDEEEIAWSAADIGKRVLAEDDDGGEHEGRIVGVEGEIVTIEIAGEDGQSFREDYFAESVIPIEKPPKELAEHEELASSQQ